MKLSLIACYSYLVALFYCYLILTMFSVPSETLNIISFPHLHEVWKQHWGAGHIVHFLIKLFESKFASKTENERHHTRNDSET